MATKINLQQLAKTLAQKKNLSQKDAEAFLKEFFDSIIQNVTIDKIVKIKGLGTFKLIEVLDRESVNVNTGERFIIPGHTKLSFTPDAALKDIVNKPFADFQTVIINEGTSIEEMEKVPACPSEPDEDEETEAEPTPVQAFAAVPEPAPEVVPVPVPETVSDVIPELQPEPVSEVIPEPVPDSVAEPKEEPVPERQPEPVAEPKGDNDGKKPFWSMGKVLAAMAGVVLLCALCFLAGRSINASSEASEQAGQQVETPVETPAPEIEYAQVPDGEYKIVGTLKTHVMKPGDYLSKLAIEVYGDKDFTKYIIVHNDFPDPDNVPVDMEVKLPKLEPVN